MLLVRLKEKKEPVCIIRPITDLVELFWAIDEFCDPNIVETKIVSLSCIEIGWPGQLEIEDGEFCFMDATLSERSYMAITDHFGSCEDWFEFKSNPYRESLWTVKKN